MKYNRFFIINHDLSHNTNEQVFYYTRIIHKSILDNEYSQAYTYYPFYLTFKPFRIDFNYYGPSPGYKKGEDAYQELKHNTIFSLPLSFDYKVNDNLTSKLIDLFDEETKFDKCYHYNPDQDFEINPIDSSTVFSYNCVNISKDNCNLPQKNTYINRISHRTIFLDFLFDFNEVKKLYNDFAYCPFYDEIETRLRQNDFFNAIATKYSYYYNQERLAEIAADNHGQNQLISIQKQMARFNKTIAHKDFRERFIALIPESNPLTSVEEYQLERLLNRYKIGFCYESLLIILSKPKWNTHDEKSMLYKEFESEYRSELTNKNARIRLEIKKYAGIKDKWIDILQKENSSSFILPEHKWWKHFEIEMEDVYFAKRTTSRLLLREKDELNRIETAKWFSNRYDILKSFLLILGYPFGNWKLTQRSINVQIGCMLLAYFSLVSFAFFMALPEKNSKELSTIIVYFSFSNMGLFFILTILFFVSGIVNKYIHGKANHHKLSIRTAGFFLPRLLMAIISGWLFLAIAGEELWKFELDMRFSSILKISTVLLILMIFFLYLEIWKVNPKSWKSALSRVFSTIYLGLVYSLIIGFFVIVFTSQKIIHRSNFFQQFTYNAIARKSMIDSSYKATLLRLPEYVGTKEQYITPEAFSEWITDSPAFLSDSIIENTKINWSQITEGNINLYSYLKSISENTDENVIIFEIQKIDFIASDIGVLAYNFITSVSNNSNINLIKNLDTSYIKKEFLKIRNSRNGIVRDANKSLVNINYPKPLLDNYIFIDFLTELSYDSKEIHIVEMVEVPLLEKEVAIFPSYLVLNSFLALFIGVFLQMMFDKKNIAEPL